MTSPLTTIQRFGATVYHSSQLKASRNKLDLYADRIRQASVEPTLLAFCQRLCDLMEVETSKLYQPAVTSVLTLGTSPEAPAVLQWVRQNHTMYAVLCASKHADADEVLSQIQIPSADAHQQDIAVPRRPYQIGIRAELLTPLSHGADSKSGNATLFRRLSVLGVNGSIMELPYYAGNAIRGQVRDLLADHFAERLGLIPRRDTPPFALWFFHALYAGGALEETSAATKAIAKEIGNHGAVCSDGIRRFRDTLPALSLLGCALGNRVISGHADFGDLRPVCIEWNNGGNTHAASLFDWLYLTRREDHENYTEHSGMIAVTEVLKPGAILEGGINVRLHCSDLSRSALGVGLRLLADRGRIGAQNRADLGGVRIEYTNLPDPDPYEQYLAENKDQILDYLRAIDALAK